MAKRITTGKRDREQLKEQKRQEKQKRKDERKSGGTSSFEDMIAYVDENGILHTTPQDVKPKTEIDVSRIEISTPKRSVRGRAVVRQGIRPDTLLMIGQFGHWETPLAKDFDVPSLNTLASMSMAQTDATGSGADIVRVSLKRGTT